MNRTVLTGFCLHQMGFVSPFTEMGMKTLLEAGHKELNWRLNAPVNKCQTILDATSSDAIDTSTITSMYLFALGSLLKMIKHYTFRE